MSLRFAFVSQGRDCLMQRWMNTFEIRILAEIILQILIRWGNFNYFQIYRPYFLTLTGAGSLDLHIFFFFLYFLFIEILNVLTAFM